VVDGRTFQIASDDELARTGCHAAGRIEKVDSC
jgi:hypothetical protein